MGSRLSAREAQQQTAEKGDQGKTRQGMPAAHDENYSGIFLLVQERPARLLLPSPVVALQTSLLCLTPILAKLRPDARLSPN